jgi:ABC-type nickel/cobalt efflux system permease component RcnA
MKRLKYFLSIAGLALVIVCGFWFFYQQSIHHTFMERKVKVDSLWQDFKTELDHRDNYFMNLGSNRHFDSIQHFILKSKSERKENTPEMMQIEYRINQSMMHYYPNEDICALNDSLNEKTTKYNDAVKSFNTFCVQFPNAVVAKKYNLKTIKRFDVLYGKKNINPLNTSKGL